MTAFLVYWMICGIVGTTMVLLDKRMPGDVAVTAFFMVLLLGFIVVPSVALYEIIVRLKNITKSTPETTKRGEL